MKSKVNFTLIEVLVVVAIIGILASLLLPTLSKARNKSRGSVCVNNQRNLGIAMMNFLDDNDGNYPIAGVTNVDNISWDDQISIYLGIELTDAEKNLKFFAKSTYPNNEDKFKCPNDDITRTRDEYNRTYTVVRGLGKIKIGSNWIRTTFIGESESSNISEIQDQSGSALFSEYPGDYNFIGHVSNYALSRYPNYQIREKTDMHGPYKSTFGFGDGHVELINVFSNMGASGTPDVPRGMWTTLSGD